jgi:hypothetical protein
MGETNSPSVAYVGYDISPLSRVKFKLWCITLLCAFVRKWDRGIRYDLQTHAYSIHDQHSLLLEFG